MYVCVCVCIYTCVCVCIHINTPFLLHLLRARDRLIALLHGSNGVLPLRHQLAPLAV